MNKSWNKKYFDKNNKILFEDLISTGYVIDVKLRFRGSAGVFTHGKTATIYLNRFQQDPSSFAHELLHVQFKYESGLEIGNMFYRHLPYDLQEKKLVKKRLYSHLGNMFEHVKIYPNFLKMSYQSNDFLSDNFKDKFLIKDAITLSKGFCQNNRYSRYFFDMYVGKFFVVKADVSSYIDYTSQLNILKEIDSDLFRILDSLLNNWLLYTVNTEDKAKNTEIFEEMLDEFYQNLYQWAEPKRFIY